jgi:hypothetical protein
MPSVPLIEFKVLFDDALTIYSIITAQISKSDKLKLFSVPIFMEALLNLVKSRIELFSNYDTVFEYSLSILSNLTNESPKTCETFLEKDGLNLYLIILNVRSELFREKYFFFCLKYSYINTIFICFRDL